MIRREHSSCLSPFRERYYFNINIAPPLCELPTSARSLYSAIAAAKVAPAKVSITTQGLHRQGPRFRLQY